jgi:hypothetical protein
MEIKKGVKLYSYNSGDLYLKIMAVEEKYVMARFKGCTPFVMDLSMFGCKYAAYSYTEKQDHD